MTEPRNLGRTPAERVRATLPPSISEVINDDVMAFQLIRPHVLEIGQPAPGMAEGALDWTLVGPYDNFADALDARNAMMADLNEYGLLTGSKIHVRQIGDPPQRGRRDWVDFLLGGGIEEESDSR